jgi:hypothetical protein
MSASTSTGTGKKSCSPSVLRSCRTIYLPSLPIDGFVQHGHTDLPQCTSGETKRRESRRIAEACDFSDGVQGQTCGQRRSVTLLHSGRRTSTANQEFGMSFLAGFLMPARVERAVDFNLGVIRAAGDVREGIEWWRNFAYQGMFQVERHLNRSPNRPRTCSPAPGKKQAKGPGINTA